MSGYGLTYALLQPARRPETYSSSLWRRLIAWRRREHERLLLAAMDDHALQDLGLSRVDAWQEIQKPCWRG